MTNEEEIRDELRRIQEFAKLVNQAATQMNLNNRFVINVTFSAAGPYTDWEGKERYAPDGLKVSMEDRRIAEWIQGKEILLDVENCALI